MLRQVPERKQHTIQESQLAQYMQEFMKGLYDGENTAPAVVLLLLCDSFLCFLISLNSMETLNSFQLAQLCSVSAKVIS